MMNEKWNEALYLKSKETLWDEISAVDTDFTRCLFLSTVSRSNWNLDVQNVGE